MSDDYKPNLRPGSDPLVFFKYPGDAGSEVAKGHVMTAAMAHALQDGELVVMGANSLLPMAAARLAQLTHAPNLNSIPGASGGVNTLVEPLVPSSGDYANLIAEMVLPFHEVLAVTMSGRADVFFAGGLQIDARGNCNLALIGDPQKPTVRGPGSAGTPWAHNARRTILYMTTHTKRVFVPEVDFVSMAGWPTDLKPWTKGPSLVVTPLAVLDFADGRMRLASLHPGVTLEEARDNTGFDLPFAEDPTPTTPAPTATELQIMRNFDVDGLLAIVV